MAMAARFSARSTVRSLRTHIATPTHAHWLARSRSTALGCTTVRCLRSPPVPEHCSQQFAQLRLNSPMSLYFVIGSSNRMLGAYRERVT